MRKTTLLIGIVAGIAVALLAGLGSGGGTASADNGPHMIEAGATPDKCAACHRIHTAKSDFLFKDAATVEEFCYSCHGNGGPGSDLAAQEGTFYGETTPGAPYGSKTASTTLGLRAGGFDTARIDTTDPVNRLHPSYPPSTIGVLATTQTVNSWHAIDGTTAGVMWGNGPVGTAGAGPSYALHCTSCHDPHGNGNYRILRTVPEGSGGAGYAIPDTYPKAAVDYTTADYFNMYMDLDGDGAKDTPAPIPAGPAETPAPGASILADTSAWCAQCHTRYLAVRRPTFPAPSPGVTEPDASRADSGDAIFTFRHTSAGWGRSSSTGNASFNNRACITCHASHGSNSSMPGNAGAGTNYSSTVPWPDGSIVNPSNDTQRASLLKMDNRGICRKCHAVQ